MSLPKPINTPAASPTQASCAKPADDLLVSLVADAGPAEVRQWLARLEELFGVHVDADDLIGS